MDQKAKNVVLSMDDKSQWGKVVILPNVGETTIGEDGKFTIDDVTATLLLGSGFGFTLVKGNGTTVTKNIAPEDEDEEEEDDDNENDSDEVLQDSRHQDHRPQLLLPPLLHRNHLCIS